MARVSVRYGGGDGQPYPLRTSERMLVVRTRRHVPLAHAALAQTSRLALRPFHAVARFPEHGVELLSLAGDDPSLRDAARDVLEADEAVQFAGRVLVPDLPGGDAAPVVYTENVFVQFAPDASATHVRSVLRAHGLRVRRPVEYVPNAFFTSAPEGAGIHVFELADRLLAEPAVLLCHPELVRERCTRAAFPQQWHLDATRIGGQRVTAHASVVRAWAQSTGRGATIAVIDDGVDVDHEELRIARKVVASRDVTKNTADARPGSRDNHGTACAGVACAAGGKGASGVAPDARLMPIRLASPLGAQNEADAFAWAADQGADVISCSWGPMDGDWADPSDPLHALFVPLPDSTRLAIEYALSRGRGGKGCVVCFAAGNGSEPIENDGYASHPGVIAVAACNDRSRRSVYSDVGRAVWCAFPSNDFAHAGAPSGPRTPGIWTTDRSGNPGYNPGGDVRRGDLAGHYTNAFGGTSSACPGVAGVAALILAANPALTQVQVRDVLRETCDRIDAANGRYDARGHSPWYGYGRVNAAKAVARAVEMKKG